MSQVNNDPTTNSILSGLSVNENKKGEEKKNELGQTAFLEMMVAQMSNQDPLSPQDNTEFVAQLAQFSSVEGLERLNKSFEGFSSSFMSNQALEASSLVGRSVSVPTDKTHLMEEGIISGSANVLSSMQDVRIKIYNEKGSKVAEVPVGNQPAGEMVFRWDGQNIEVNGELLDWSGGEEPVPAGEYEFEVTGVNGGETGKLETALSANVNSVTMGSDGNLVLNLAGIGAVDIQDVKQFN